MSLSAEVKGKVFCSGATGFIGGGILRALALSGVEAFGGLRRTQILPDGIVPVVTGDLAQAEFTLPQVEAVVHAAGLGHRRRISTEAWRRQNVDAAVNLARAARQAGASRFILISSAYVHGRAVAGRVTDCSPPNPADVYAQSKLEAEHEVAAAFGPGLVIIRPAAVIGPGCPGNVSLLIKCLSRAVPLPFGAIANRRSFIERGDLAAIVLAALRAQSPPESMLAAHPEAISVPALIRALAAGLGVQARLPEWPPRLLEAGFVLLGRKGMWQSLSGDFMANPAAALSLGWKPAESLEESLRRTSRYYVTTGKSA